MAHPEGRRVAPQALVLATASLFFVIWGEVGLHALLLSYGTAWLLLNAVAVARPSLLSLRLGPGQRVATIAACVGVVTVVLARQGEAFVTQEGLVTALSAGADRLRLEATPSLAPPLLRTDQPQVFYVHAPGAHDVRLRLGGTVQELGAVSLGEGLFRVRYDPREHGTPESENLRAGELAATLLVDGAAYTRDLRAVDPRAHPRWLRASPDGSRLATVSEETDEVVLVTSSGLDARFAVGDGPSDCAFVSDARLAVSHRFEPDLHIVSIADRGDPQRITVGPGQAHVAASPGGHLLAVSLQGSRRGVALLDVDAGAEVAFVPLEGEPDWVAFGRDDGTLLVTTRRPAAVLRLRAGAGGWVEDGSLLLARPAAVAARAAPGDALLLAVTGFAEDGQAHDGNHYVQDQVLTVDVGTLRVRDQRLTARRSPRQGSAGNVDRGASPMGLDAGVHLRVAFAGTDEVWHIVPGRPGPRVTPLPPDVLSAPHGIRSFADGHFAVTSPSRGAIGIFEAGGRLAHLIQLEPGDAALLEEDPLALQRRLGEHGFYEATRSGISCQSCHLHGGTDGVLRNIGGRRLAPTLTVQGVLGTAPYLRDGSYPRIRDLDHLSQTLLRGYLRRAPARGVNLEAYVESLPRPRSPGALGPDDPEEDRAGVRAFTKARCITCHAFPAFTNLGQHPVAALFPDQRDHLPVDDVLDTPSLLSVGAHPPYLSDGRAPTLRAVVRDHNPENRHGDTEALTDREMDALLGFLARL